MNTSELLQLINSQQVLVDLKKQLLKQHQKDLLQSEEELRLLQELLEVRKEIEAI